MRQTEGIEFRAISAKPTEPGIYYARFNTDCEMMTDSLNPSPVEVRLPRMHDVARGLHVLIFGCELKFPLSDFDWFEKVRRVKEASNV